MAKRTLICSSPITQGPNKGLSATGTWAGWKRHNRADDPPCRDCLDAAATKTRAYANANPDKARASREAYNKAHPDRARDSRRRTEARHRPKRVEKNRRRKARLAGVLVIAFPFELLQQRLSMFGHRCWICRGPSDGVDHVKPLSAGGMHCLANLRPVCRRCNSSKGAQWPYTLKG